MSLSADWPCYAAVHWYTAIIYMPYNDQGRQPPRDICYFRGSFYQRENPDCGSSLTRSANQNMALGSKTWICPFDDMSPSYSTLLSFVVETDIPTVYYFIAYHSTETAIVVHRLYGNHCVTPPPRPPHNIFRDPPYDIRFETPLRDPTPWQFSKLRDTPTISLQDPSS